MTNEELAELIKAGHSEYCAELWENTKKLLFYKANNFYKNNRKRCAHAGVELEDIKQACYLALLQAIRAYQPDNEYKFTTYLNYQFRNAVNNVLGIKNEKQDILSSCTSLDTPIGEDEETTLVEFISDNTDDYGSADNAQTLESLRLLLNKALETLPPNYAEVLRLKYFCCLSYAEIAERLNIGTIANVNQIAKAALKRLRKSRYINQLQEYTDIELSEY